MAKKKVDWEKLYAVIEAIPSGYWMSYGDICEAAGLKRTSAKAIGLCLAKASVVPAQIHRVLRNDGSISVSWRGEIGSADNCFSKLKAEGLKFDSRGRADQAMRHQPLLTEQQPFQPD